MNRKCLFLTCLFNIVYLPLLMLNFSSTINLRYLVTGSGNTKLDRSSTNRRNSNLPKGGSPGINF